VWADKQETNTEDKPHGIKRQSESVWGTNMKMGENENGSDESPGEQQNDFIIHLLQ